MAENGRMNRQGKVLALVQEKNQIALAQNSTDVGVSADTIAEALGIDRSNVARELSKLYKSGQLIKIQGRPTLYISRSVLAGAYPGVFFPSNLPKGAVPEDYAAMPPAPAVPQESPDIATTLETRVGVYHTLRSAVLRAKAAVTYPSHDMHTLITGPVGVGKAQFARQMYEHGVSRGILQPDAPYITVNCQEHNVSPQLLLGQLFGYARDATPKGEKSRRGLIERAAGGILCLNGVEDLPPMVQDALITLLEKRTYTRVGEASVQRYSNAMIIAISTESAGAESMAALSQRFPVQVHIPDLNRWHLRELAEILIQVFQKESIATGLRFRITREAFGVFLKATYPGNLGELNSVVRTTCALVFLESEAASPQPQTMEITLRHLQPELLESIREDGPRDSQISRMMGELDLEYLSFTPMGFSTNRYTASQFLDLLHREAETKAPSAPSPLSAAAELTRSYFAGQQVPGAMLLSTLQNRFSEKLAESARGILAGYPAFSGIGDNPSSFYRLLACLEDGMAGMLPALENSRPLRARIQAACPAESACAEALCAAAGGPCADSTLIYLSVCLNLLRGHAARPEVPILAVYHGQGVAEAMAAYVNAALGCNLVTGISDPPNMPFGELLEAVYTAARQVHRGQGVLLAVDMPPLTNLHEYLYQSTGIRAETIANVSLPGLLAMGRQSLQSDSSIGELAQQLQTEAPGAPVREDSFLSRTINELLEPSLTFLNPRKATRVLHSALRGLLQELNVDETSEIVIKFIFHCSHMLERLIRKEPLRFDSLKTFINRNSHLIATLEKHMQAPAEIFGVSIPSSELAYIAEILQACLG